MIADRDRRRDHREVGKSIVLALPLGLGKANHIANAIYARAAADRSIQLTIFTALTLEQAARPRVELERRFIGPIVGAAVRRLSGARLCDGDPASAGCRPMSRSTSSSFWPVQRLGSPASQQQLHLARTTPTRWVIVLDRGVNVVAQLVAKRRATATSALQPELQSRPHARSAGGAPAGRANFCSAGQVNSELPFMPGDADISAGEFDFLLDSPATDFPLFAPPREPIDAHRICRRIMHARSMVRTAAPCSSASARLATRSRRR